LPWWRSFPNETYAFFIRVGAKPLDFEKGKTAIAVQSLDKLPSLIDTLITAVRNGEFNEQLAQAAKSATVRKSRKGEGERDSNCASLPLLMFYWKKFVACSLPSFMGNPETTTGPIEPKDRVIALKDNIRRPISAFELTIMQMALPGMPDSGVTSSGGERGGPWPRCSAYQLCSPSAA
jgi:hypothetical protein